MAEDGHGGEVTLLRLLKVRDPRNDLIVLFQTTANGDNDANTRA